MAETNLPAQAVDWFEREHKVMTLFIDNAKTYVQLSVGALLLSVTFLREVLGQPKETPIHLDWALVVCWICFLMAVIFDRRRTNHAEDSADNSQAPRNAGTA